MEKELERWREHVGSNGTKFWLDFLAEATAQESELCEERRHFLEHTIQPLWTLKYKLKAGVEQGQMEGRVNRWQLHDELKEMKERNHSICELMKEEVDLLLGEVSAVCVVFDREKDPSR